ncbi:MAG TPA: glycosyltransferase family 2 protein [Gammaproteobacteria bacterium]|nr:glycosyltransferase family 2 protein [Gammaproteobacteria bacterium]
MTTKVEVVLPAHNEGDAIEGTLREFHQIVTEQNDVDLEFIVCEDGSTDNTVAVILHVAKDLPIQLITSSKRKGYSRAVIDGFKRSSADYVGFIDSDGQCDPSDFRLLWEERSTADLIVGYRNPRNDNIIRRLMSGAFGVVYKTLFPVRLKDPSSPYLLISRRALKTTMQGETGILAQGFWWEFYARATAAGVSIFEVPINHRVRAAGETVVYRPAKIPRIAAEHLAGLWKLRAELLQRTRNREQ